MTYVIDKSELAKKVIKMVELSPVDFAVAFWGQGATEQFGLSAETREKVRIICNLKMGGTNPYEIEKLWSSEFKVLQNDSLHSKYYLSESGVIIGSSNASANGLSFQGDELSGWHEMNLYTSKKDVIAKVKEDFEALWKASHEITESDIETAKEIWSSRRRTTVTGAGAKKSKALAYGMHLKRIQMNSRENEFILRCIS